MASPVTLPVKLELTSAVVVRPGDKLVLGFANGLDPQQAKDIRQRVSELLPRRRSGHSCRRDTAPRS